MNFSLGTEITSMFRFPMSPQMGPVNTGLPQISGLSEIGNTLTVSDGNWAGTGALIFAFVWLRNGAQIPGATANTYVLQGGDDQALVACRVNATDDEGTSVAIADGVNAVYPAPVFSQQPSLSPASGAVDTIFNLTLGSAGPNTILSVIGFSLDGFDKSAELAGLSWDSAGEMAGNLNLQVMATNSGGSVLSDVVTAVLTTASATVPDAILDANWSVVDAAAGGTLTVTISAMADNGGAPISSVEYQLDSVGPWAPSGLVDAGGFTIGGVANGQATSVTLRAVNSIGAGAVSSIKSATPGAGANPTVAITTLNRANGEIDMTGVSSAGTYFGLVNYVPAPLAGATIEAAVTGMTADAYLNFAVVTGANAGTYDKTNVVTGTAYFHGVIKNATGNYSADIPLAFIQPFIDTQAPVLQSSAPANGAVNQPTGTDVLLSFDEDIQLISGVAALFDVANSNTIETFDAATGTGDQGGTITVLGKVVTINPGAELVENTQYSIRTLSSSAIQDTAGNSFAGWVDDNGQLNFTTAVAGAGVAFIGDADSTIWDINHVMGSGSNSQTALPSTYAAGTYVILAAVDGSKDVTSLSLDGVGATLRANGTSGSERVAVYDVTIPGGGDGTVSLGLNGSADDVGVAVWDVGNRVFVSAVAQNFSNRKTDIPADLSTVTLAGDAVMTAVLHGNSTATSNWTGLSEVVASRALNDRVFAAAHMPNAQGGTPEVFQWSPSVNWVGVGAVLAIYR